MLCYKDRMTVRYNSCISGKSSATVTNAPNVSFLPFKKSPGGFAPSLLCTTAEGSTASAGIPPLYQKCCSRWRQPICAVLGEQKGLYLHTLMPSLGSLRTANSAVNKTTHCHRPWAYHCTAQFVIQMRNHADFSQLKAALGSQNPC